MNEKFISTLVFIAVLAVAGVGLYIAFNAGLPGEGKSIEGARAFSVAHKPYVYGPLQILADELRDAPRKELPAADMWKSGFCVLMFNPRSASVIPVPVGRHRAPRLEESDTVQMMLNRDWVVVDVIPASRGYICPPPEEVPTLYDLVARFEL